MRLRTFKKDIWRSVRGSLSRFFAIFAIVALGAGFYAGLSAAAPDMRLTIDQYCDDNNMMDIHLLSTLGFNEADIDAIRAREGISGVMAGYSADFLCDVNGREQVVRTHALPADTGADNLDYINRPVLVDGRMPRSANECLLGAGKFGQSALGIGSQIVLRDPNDNLDDTLHDSTYTIVGLVESSFYLSFNLGSSSIGSGTIDLYLYLPESAFCAEVYTDVYATVDGALAANAFTDGYDNLVDPVIDSIEGISDGRVAARYDEVIGEANEKIADAQIELDDARVEADEKLTDALQELTDGQKKLDDGAREIRDNQKKLTDAAAKIEETNATLRSAQNAHDEGSAKYQAALAQYNDGLAQYNAGLAAYNQNLQNWQQLDLLKRSYWYMLDTYTQTATPDIPNQPLDPGNPTGMKMGEAAAELLAQLGSADEAIQQAALDGMKQALDAGKATLDQTKATLDAGAPQLTATGEQLKAAGEQIANGWYALNTARAQLEDGKKALNDARIKLEDGKVELADGWVEYNDKKLEADEKLADAQKELDDARAKLAELDEPEWYVLSRHTNYSFASYEADADRMASLSTVFPYLFFLVAALVALTTMTRMIEEERGMIGTYKALGYSGGRIMSKYLLYALFASVLGAAAGIAVGLVTLPSVIYNAYGIMYIGPSIMYGLNLNYVLSGAAASIACTMIATYAACRSSLGEQTASLLQPKAPKPGKRILLERIGFIWNRMKFTSKVTWRNIFRYKKRLIMTLVGIAGCTGLLLTGFGIKDSVSIMLPRQFNEIFVYNTMIAFEDEAPSAGLRAILDDEMLFSRTLITAVKAADLTVGEDTMQGYIVVPQENALDGFVNLRDRLSGKPVAFGADSVVMTEKAAKELGIGVGDSVYIKNTDGRLVSFTLTGITENYIYHYLYIAPELYESRMGEAPVYNRIDAVTPLTDERARTALADRILAADGVSTMTYTNQMSGSFENMVSSLNYVVYVLIFCAGALAFVVLYNLTNINITERRRELATIKVLGFHRNELQNYIFRETNLLTLFGSLIGLGAGTVMHAFVIQTVEVDMVMFGRDVLPLSYLIAFLMTNFFSLLVNIFMKPSLRKIDMVESLKSVD